MPAMCTCFMRFLHVLEAAQHAPSETGCLQVFSLYKAACGAGRQVRECHEARHERGMPVL